MRRLFSSRRRRGLLAPRASALLLVVALAATTTTTQAASLASFQDLGAVDGSARLGASILAAGDRLSLRRAAGLGSDGAVSVEQVTPDSPYATFSEVTRMSSFVAALQTTLTVEAAQQQAEALLSESEYAAYLELAQQLANCYGSMAPAGEALSDTWSQGVGSTTQGQAAAKTVDAKVGTLTGLNKEERAAVKAALALYDTWVKTGSPSRQRQRRAAAARGDSRQQRKQHRKQQALGGDGGWSKLPLPMTGTYDALKGYSTEECRAAYKRMSELYNSGDLGDNNGGLGNQLPGQGSLPGSGSMPGQGGGMPGGGQQGGLPGNPFGSSPMSGQEPGAGGVPPNPFDGATSTNGQEPGTGSGNPLDGATNTAGRFFLSLYLPIHPHPGQVRSAALFLPTHSPIHPYPKTNTPTGQEPTPPLPTEAPATVADTGTNKCKTYNDGAIGVQLCQGSTVTASSATITGSIINVGDDTLCNLALLIDSFELSSSFYPNWLPSYGGEFKAGDTITFGVTVPYTTGTARPQADIDSSISLCVAATPPPTPSPTNATTSSPTLPPTTTLAPTKKPPPVFDWANIGGMDTKCVKGCVNILEALSACEAFDAIFAFRCDVCDAVRTWRVDG